MADRFLREVKRMHQLRADINEMTPEEADELIRGLGDDAAEDWIFAARDAQLPPSDLSWCWLFLGGRGAGKSHSMSAAGIIPRFQPLPRLGPQQASTASACTTGCESTRGPWPRVRRRWPEHNSRRVNSTASLFFGGC